MRVRTSCGEGRGNPVLAAPKPDRELPFSRGAQKGEAAWYGLDNVTRSGTPGRVQQRRSFGMHGLWPVKDHGHDPVQTRRRNGRDTTIPAKRTGMQKHERVAEKRLGQVRF